MATTTQELLAEQILYIVERSSELTRKQLIEMIEAVADDYELITEFK